MDPGAAHYAHRRRPPVKHAGRTRRNKRHKIWPARDQWCLLSCPVLELTLIIRTDAAQLDPQRTCHDKDPELDSPGHRKKHGEANSLSEIP